VAARRCAEIDQRKRHDRIRSDDPEWLAVDRHECRAQHVVAPRHDLEASRERCRVERSAQPRGDGKVVVRAIALELLEEPETLLPERQGPMTQMEEDLQLAASDLLAQ